MELCKKNKVLHHYFGKKVFDCVVIAVTNCPGKYQRIKFDDEDYDMTKKTFQTALRIITGDRYIACPPVTYIGLDDGTDEVLSKIQIASVLRERPFPLIFTKGFCARCICYDDDTKQVCGVDACVYEKKCHPLFIPKSPDTFFDTARRLLQEAFNQNVSINYTHEICISCRRPPGSEGCTAVGQEITVGAKTLKVNHSSEL